MVVEVCLGFHLWRLRQFVDVLIDEGDNRLLVETVGEFLQRTSALGAVVLVAFQLLIAVAVRAGAGDFDIICVGADSEVDVFHFCC